MLELVYILILVGPEYHFFGAGSGSKKIAFANQSFVQQLPGNELVLEHGEAMAFGQRMGVDRIESNAKRSHSVSECA